MVGRDGRVLIANPAGWVERGGRAARAAAGRSRSPTGARRWPSRSRTAAACCGASTGRAVAAPARPALRLELLGRQGLTARVGARPHAAVGRAPGRDPRAARAAPEGPDRRAAHARALRRAGQPGLDARPGVQAAPPARPAARRPALPAARPTSAPTSSTSSGCAGRRRRRARCAPTAPRCSSSPRSRGSSRPARSSRARCAAPRCSAARTRCGAGWRARAGATTWRRCASSCAKRRPTTRAPRSPWRGCGRSSGAGRPRARLRSLRSRARPPASTIGRKRASTSPAGATRNFSKFHWMSPASPSASGVAVSRS